MCSCEGRPKLSSATTQRAGVVTRPHRAGTRRGQVVGERVGPRTRQPPRVGHAGRAATRRRSRPPVRPCGRPDRKLKLAVVCSVPNASPIFERGDTHAVMPPSRRATSSASAAARSSTTTPQRDCARNRPAVDSITHRREDRRVRPAALRPPLEGIDAWTRAASSPSSPRRSAYRAGGAARRSTEPLGAPLPDRTVERNLAHVRRPAGGCTMRRAGDPLVLEFDHVDQARRSSRASP